MTKMILPTDFRDFLKLLISQKVKFLLIGGYAVVHYGFPRYTGDIDIWVESGLVNAEKLVLCLKKFGFDIPKVTTDLFSNPGKIIRLGEEPFRIELMTKIDGVVFERAFKNKVKLKFDGLIIPVISLKDLRKNKKASGRAKDLSDLENLPKS